MFIVLIYWIKMYSWSKYLSKSVYKNTQFRQCVQFKMMNIPFKNVYKSVATNESSLSRIKCLIKILILFPMLKRINAKNNKFYPKSATSQKMLFSTWATLICCHKNVKRNNNLYEKNVNLIWNEVSIIVVLHHKLIIYSKSFGYLDCYP